MIKIIQTILLLDVDRLQACCVLTIQGQEIAFNITLEEAALDECAKANGKTAWDTDCVVTLCSAIVGQTVVAA